MWKTRVNYYLTRSRRQEVDFIAADTNGKPVLAVQACMKFNADDGILEREVSPLSAAANYFDIKEALVLTIGEERTIEHDGVRVHVLPAWRWMAENRRGD